MQVVKMSFLHRLSLSRAGREYWEKIRPSSGRPYCSAMSKPDNWGVTAGDEILRQKKEETSTEEIALLKAKRQKQANGIASSF